MELVIILLAWTNCCEILLEKHPIYSLVVLESSRFLIWSTGGCLTHLCNVLQQENLHSEFSLWHFSYFEKNLLQINVKIIHKKFQEITEREEENRNFSANVVFSRYKVKAINALKLC